MTAWQWVIGPWNAVPSHEMTRASNRSATFRLGPDANSEASFDVNGASDDAQLIDELVTDLWIYCDGVPLYRGRVGPTQDAWDDTASKETATISTADYRAVLARRELYELNTRSWSVTDQALIAWQMIQQTQGNTAGALGITPGVGSSTGVNRSYNADPGAMVGTEIDKLAAMGNGFEWDITPTATTTLHLDIWHPQRGSDRGVVLVHGDNAKAVSRSIDPGAYANALRMSGGTPPGGGTDPTVQLRQAADITSRPEGRWDASYGDTDITLTTPLSAAADGKLTQAQILTPSWIVALPANTWLGPGHIWLGDPVRWVCQSGRFDVDETLRVIEIAATWTGNGSVKAQLTLGAPTPGIFRQRRVDQRLIALERR